MDIGKWLFQRKTDDQVFLRDEVTELLEAFQKDSLAGAASYNGQGWDAKEKNEHTK